MKVKIITSAYVMFVVAVVVVADSHAWHGLLRPVRALPFGDKAGHFVLMGLLSLLVNLCLSCRRVRLGGLRPLSGSLVVSVIVLLEEFSQLFVRTRSFDPADLLFDFLGIFLFGRLACRLVRPRPGPAFSR
jgi:VanZ family protein